MYSKKTSYDNANSSKVDEFVRSMLSLNPFHTYYLLIYPFFYIDPQGVTHSGNIYVLPFFFITI